MTLALALALYGLVGSLAWSIAEAVRHELARRRAVRIVFPPVRTIAVLLIVPSLFQLSNLA